MKQQKWLWFPISVVVLMLGLRYSLVSEHVNNHTLILLDLKESNECLWAHNPVSTACKQKSMEALARVAQRLVEKSASSRKLKEFGEGWGMHTLVDTGKPNTTCIFYSYGISRDYSFDEHLARDWQCKGFLFDPSIIHPAKLKHNLHFFNLGAPLLDGELQTDCFSDPNGRKCTDLAEWVTVSPPLVMAMFRHRHLNVLKMDCEGCEFALARDVAAHDPAFFSKVDQFAIEVSTAYHTVSSKQRHFLLFPLRAAMGRPILESRAASAIGFFASALSVLRPEPWRGEGVGRGLKALNHGGEASSEHEVSSPSVTSTRHGSNTFYENRLI